MLFAHIGLLLCAASAWARPESDLSREMDAQGIQPKLSYSRKVVSKPGTAQQIDCGVEGIDLSGVQGFNIQWSKINLKNPINSYPISSGQQVVLFSEKYDVLHPENSNQYNLKINDINEDDEGTYRCTVHFGSSQRITADVPVLVEKAPYFNTKMTRALTVKEGDTISIDCQPGGSPTPTVYWQRVDNFAPFSAGNFAQKNQIEITDASSDDEGMYVCHADNGVGEPVRSQVIINVMYKPRLTVPSKEVPTELLQAVTVSCTADAYDAATIVWKKNGHDVMDSYNVKIKEEIVKRPKEEVVPGMEQYALKPDFTKSSLTINSLSMDEAGEYICEATNQAGKTSATMSVEVMSPPMILKQSSRKHYYEDPIGEHRDAKDVVLECETSGTPTPKVTWMKDGEPVVDQANARYTIDQYGNLHITKPNLLDNGLYQCLAKNEYGVAKSDLMRLVNATQVSFTKATSTHTDLENAEEGRPYVLQCPEALGDPKPKVTWIAVTMPNGTEEGATYGFVQSHRTVVGPKGTLVFTHVTMEDDWETSRVKYMCTASSTVSPYDFSIGHQVEMKVVKPVDGYENAKTSEYNIQTMLVYGEESKTVRGAQENRLHCIFAGEPAPHIYWEREDGKAIYDAPDHFELDSFNTTLVLKNTNQRDHKATYRCIASNGVGGAVIHEMDIDVVQPPMFKRGSMQSYTVKEGEDVTFKCDADATGAITYSWFFNGRPLSASFHGSDRRKTSGSMLSIASVSPSDIGNYACNATSPDGYAYGQSTLNVQPLVPKPSGAGSAEVKPHLVEILKKLNALEASQQVKEDKVYNLLEKIAQKLNVEPVEAAEMKEVKEEGVINVMTEKQEKTKVEKPEKVSGISLTT